MQILFDRVDRFLTTPAILPKLIVIYGPTACGKTTFSIELAKRLGSEVIGADSRQIYRGLDIGTGKVTEAEKQGIEHHMIDIIHPDQEYSVGEYQKAVFPIIKNLHDAKKIPLLCGGTGLYIDAVVFHFDIPATGADWGYREELEQLRLEKGNEYLWNLLNEVDPEYAKELHYNNHRYVARGLEVIRATGQSKRLIQTKKEPIFDTLFLTPYDDDRAKLYARINARVEGMYEQGLIEEVTKLLSEGYPKTSFGLNTIGYKETISYLEGAIDLETCRALVKQGNRNYAKRQLTWFRRYV